MEKNHFEQAKLWLEGAKYISDYNTDNKAKYAVAVQLPIGLENTFDSVIDLVERRAFKFEGKLGEDIVEVTAVTVMQAQGKLKYS